MTDRLPIEDALPELLRALAGSGQAVLQAPPGAGKTTRVPLALLSEGRIKGRILMLEPRRLATRASAARMAEMLGDPLGRTIGYRIRGDSRTSAESRIEVVTEGILTRMIQSDPELAGVGLVIFDEFHERSLQADLGLALCLEIREALRPDLELLVMSATLDAAPVAALMGGAPVITARGRAFPVETRHLPRPWSRAGAKGVRFEAAMADLITRALAETEGGLLAFLPGAGEIRRCAQLLQPRLPEGVALHQLYGALPFAEQRAAIAPERGARKLVLATSIAETSLTIEDIRVVVDGGRARRARFDPGSGMSRLVTEKVTRAEATQRAGRAGRLAPGVCYRLWTKGEEGALGAFPPPEILTADLAALVLDCAQWGAGAPADLPFLTPPDAGAVAAARGLLQALGALDEAGRITGHGRELAALPLHPRLGQMLCRGGAGAPLAAALLSARDILKGSPRPPVDLALRLEAARDPNAFEAEHPWRVDRATLARVRQEAKRLRANGKARLGPGEMAALAYADRIGLRRAGDAPRYLLSSGSGAVLDAADPLAHARLIVACDLDGDRREARVRLAAAISESDLRALFGQQIKQVQTCVWSRRERRVRAMTETRFGALVLAESRWRDCPAEKIAAAMAEGIRDLGPGALPLDKAAQRLIARIEWLRSRGAALPDSSVPALIDGLDDWLTPHLGACRSPDDLARLDFADLIAARLTWEQRQNLEQLAPGAITAPTGTRLPIDYSGEVPKVSVRLQEMFGLTRHPVIGPDRVALLIELLSPARRPIQLTRDLTGFWASSYADVRKEMRGRYPKHPWPENPAEAPATRRTKPRGRG